MPLRPFTQSIGVGFRQSGRANVMFGGGPATLVLSASPFYGQVGTRTAANNTTTSSAVMGRTAHYIRANETISQLWIAYANWRVTISGGVGEESGGTLTTKLGYETVGGTKVQCTISGGGATGTASALTEQWFTTGTLATPLSPGDKFYLRPLLSTTDSNGLGAVARNADSGQGDAFEATSTDKTISGTVAQSANNCIYPIAIVGLTTRGSVALINSDSRVMGQADAGSGTYGDWGLLARPVGSLLYAYQNLGIAGDLANGWVSRAARRIAIAQWSTTWLGNNMVNQIAFGASTTQTDILAAASAAHTANRRYGHVTCPPKTTSTDNWKTSGNQTQDAAKATFFDVLNDWMRTTPAGLDYYCEVADAQESGRNTGLWKSDGVTDFLYTVDGLHSPDFANSQVSFSSFVSAMFGATAPSTFMPSSPPF